MLELDFHITTPTKEGISMEKEELITTVKFAQAVISPQPEFGFILLALHHWQKNGSEMESVPGLFHSLRPEQVEDLIGHLQHALDLYRNPTEPYSGRSRSH